MNLFILQVNIRSSLGDDDLQIAVCDDEPIELKHVIELLYKYNAQINVDGFLSTKELYSALKVQPYDIVLLDIEMPDINGYKIAKQITKNITPSPMIIFVTKSTAYAIQGYDVAFHYIVKPIDFGKFCDVMDRACRKIVSSKFVFQCNGTTHCIMVNNIIYIEILRFTITIHCKNNVYQIRSSMKKISQELCDSGFYRVHNSFLVNFQYIDRIASNEVTLSNGVVIPISRSNKKGFQLAFQQYMRKI